MLKVVHITKDHPEMAIDEVKALTASDISERFDDILIIDSDFDALAHRLAYANAVYRFLFTCDERFVLEHIREQSWPSLYAGPLAVRFPGDRPMERLIAKEILKRVKDSEVDLENPMTRIDLFKRGDKVICGLLESENVEDFNARKAHHRKAPHPSSMHPKLCRWFVNMTGIRDGILIDPFCGSGGVLLEAALMGFDSIGYDIVPEMIDRAKINLEDVKPTVTLEMKDALSINEELHFVATDFPYGRATSATELEPLYAGFFKVLEKHLKGRAVLGYPDSINIKALFNQNKLKVVGEYSYYLHRSLTKKMIVVESLN